MPDTLTLIESDTFELRYDDANQFLRGSWPAPVLDADLRSHYAELLAATQYYGNCRYWLLDLRHRNWHMPSFGRWFSTEFATAVHAALGRPVFIAYVLGPRHYTIAESERTQQVQYQSVDYNVYPYSFASEADALDWLRHQQRLDA